MSAIIEIVEGLKFSCFTDKFKISGVFLEVYAFMRVVNRKTLLKNYSVFG